jgi:hypothetical protein
MHALGLCAFTYTYIRSFRPIFNCQPSILKGGTKQWRSQDLHMEGVGRAKRDRHGQRRQRRRRPCWGWVREGVIPLPEGGSVVSPRENFRNLTTLMCILETEIFT